MSEHLFGAEGGHSLKMCICFGNMSNAFLTRIDYTNNLTVLKTLAIYIQQYNNPLGSVIVNLSGLEIYPIIYDTDY